MFTRLLRLPASSASHGRAAGPTTASWSSPRRSSTSGWAPATCS